MRRQTGPANDPAPSNPSSRDTQPGGYQRSFREAVDRGSAAESMIMLNRRPNDRHQTAADTLTQFSGQANDRHTSAANTLTQFSRQPVDRHQREQQAANTRNRRNDGNQRDREATAAEGLVELRGRSNDGDQYEREATGEGHSRRHGQSSGGHRRR